jgi:hypothetical protein
MVKHQVALPSFDSQIYVMLRLQVLERSCFSELVSEGTTWTRTPYRAFYRAMYGVANTLRKMGR